VCAHTTAYVVHEFWECALANPALLHTIITAEDFKFDHPQMFEILQQSWPTYRDPYVRSSLFFILNRHSGTGLISSGKFSKKNINPLAISYLQHFKVPNFHLQWDNEPDFIASIDPTPGAQFLLFPVGGFSHNLFETGKNHGYETTSINHQQLYTKLETLNDQYKWIALYDFHPEILKLYKDYTLVLLNAQGSKTSSHDECKGIVIANF
jgi:site-specific DNA-adenine methylase